MSQDSSFKNSKKLNLDICYLFGISSVFSKNFISIYFSKWVCKSKLLFVICKLLFIFFSKYLFRTIFPVFIWDCKSKLIFDLPQTLINFFLTIPRTLFQTGLQRYVNIFLISKYILLYF